MHVLKRIRDERALALPFALIAMVLMSMTTVAAVNFSSSSGRTANLNRARVSAEALAEAGINDALAVLNNAVDPKTATLLQPTTETLPGGSVTYSGTYNSATFYWTITSTGTVANPTGGAPTTRTLQRGAQIYGIGAGNTTSGWSRFYHDSTTTCLTIDSVTIPSSLASRGALCLRNGGNISGATTSVAVGTTVTVDPPPAVTVTRAPSAATGWTSSSSVYGCCGAYATASISASGTSPNLDVTNFGFNIPSGSTIDGITASVVRHEAVASGSITADAATSATAATAGTTLAWSHTVANQSNRVLVVGATAEYSSTLCQATAVTYGAQALTKITQNVAGTSTYMCASLWYLVAPNVGTNTITVTYQSSITNRTAGAVGLWNVKQAAPDASNSSFNNAAATSTSVTTVAASSWVVDVFGSGQPLGNLAPSSGQTGRWTQDSGATQSSGMSTKPVVAAGATTLGWTQTGINRSAQVVAAFAPAAGDLTDQDVYLLKAGSPAGSDHAGTAAWSTSDVTQSYGSSSDLWGTTWTPAQINASNFGVRLKVLNTSATASNTAYVDYIEVTVRYSADTTTAVGSSGANILRADIGGTCTYNGGTPHTPCSSADRVYADTITNAPVNLVKPSVDMAWWWANAKPGPKHNCTEAGNSFPGGFDNDAGSTSAPNNSVPGLAEVTPTGSSYTCQVKENGVLVGEISWNHITHVLKIYGTIYVDGDFRFDDDGQLVNYQGRGIIYATDDVEFDERVCAGGTGTTDCTTAMSTWDAAQNMITILAGDDLELDHNGSGPSAFQGTVYAVDTCTIHEFFYFSGPAVCDKIVIGQGNESVWPTFYTWTPAGTIVDGQMYSSPIGAADYEVKAGVQTG